MLAVVLSCSEVVAVVAAVQSQSKVVLAVQSPLMVVLAVRSQSKVVLAVQSQSKVVLAVQSLLAVVVTVAPVPPFENYRFHSPTVLQVVSRDHAVSQPSNFSSNLSHASASGSNLPIQTVSRLAI